MDTLDIELPEPTTLLAQAKDVLRSASIPFGRLHFVADESQNVGITDNSRVYMKIYRRRDGLNEFDYTRLARRHGARTPRPLLSTDWCSVWEYLHLRPLPVSRLPEVMRNIRHIHDATRNQSLIEQVDYDQARTVVEGRLQNVSSPLASEVEEQCNRTCERLKMLTEGRDSIFAHGDLQFRNLGVSGHDVYIFDWEICKMAPVEFELSKTAENLFTANDWHENWASQLYGSVDQELMMYFTHLRYTQNLAFFIERNDVATVEKQEQAWRKFIDLTSLKF